METPDPDINQLLKAFALETPDRVPYLDYWITSVEIIEHVLGRKARYMELSEQKKRQSSTLGAPIIPEDMVEFTRRIGMDAVGVTFVWRPGTVFRLASDGTQHYVNGDIKNRDDLKKMESPPDIGEDLKILEQYLEIAEGTNIGVYPSVSSFFDGTYLAIGTQDFMLTLYDDRRFLETLMDIIWEYYSRVIEAVSRYDEISFVFVNDDIAFKNGLMIRPEIFRELFVPRMEKMLYPVKSKNKILTYHTDGNLEEAIPILLELGFSAVHPIDPPANNIYELKKEFGDKICLVGNIETPLLAYGTKEEIEADVIEHIERLSPGGAYVASSGNSIMQGIPPDNFLTFVDTVHKFGKLKETKMSTLGNKISVRTAGLLKEPEITVVVALSFLFVILSITTPRFLSSYNLFSILKQSSIVGIVAMGQTLALIVGGFDLSVGSVAGLAGIVSGVAMVNLELSLPICILLGILVGAACGCSNGIIITKIGISPLIVTLGTSLIFKGLILVTTRGYPILKFPSGFYFLGQGYFGPVPLPVILMLITGAVCYTFLSLTRFGNHIYAVGSNEDASYLFGIKVHRVQIATYSICGSIAAFGGIILASRLSSAQPSAGQGMVLPSIAIAVIGGTKLGGGSGRVSGTILGAVLIGVINNALVLLGVSPYVQDIVSGGILIVAVGVDIVRRGR